MMKFMLWGLLLVSLTAKNISANDPLPPKSLEERIALASHVFIGTMTDVYFIDKSGRPTTPEVAIKQDPNPILELNVQVEQMLKPDKDRHRTINLRFGNLYPRASAERLKKALGGWKLDYLNKRFIYLTRERNDEYGHYFVASYGWYLETTMDKKVQVVKIIQQMKKPK